MNKVIREKYPASNLPADLRNGIDPATTVTVIIEEEKPSDYVPMTLEEIFSLRQAPYRSAEDILHGIRDIRDEWDV